MICRRSISVALFLVLGVVGTASGQQPASRTPLPGGGCSIDGRVLYSDNLTGAERVMVRLLWNGTLFNQTITQSQGAFRFLSLPLGVFELEVTADGYHTVRESADLSFSCHAISLTLYLERDPDQRAPAGSPGPPVSARVLQIPGKARGEFERGFNELTKKERPERSLDYFRRAIELYPNYDEAYVQLALAHLRMEQPADAQRVLETAVTVYPGNARAHTLLGILLGQQGKTDDAQRELEAAVAIDDADWRAHFELGRLFLKQRQGAPARAHARRAHDLNPKEPDVHLLLHDALLLQNDREAALAEAEEFIKLFPGDELTPRLRDHIAHLRASLRAKTP